MSLPLPRLFSPKPATVVLAIVLTCQLMIVLDASVVITALPQIHSTLGFSSTGLAWVQNAYTLAFGGLMLLGARAGDLLGRRRVFAAGLALFSVASLLGGLAQSPGWLVSARAVQGVGAAIAAPATLALLTSTFTESLARLRALAAYSAVSAAGGSLGLLLGGALTSWVSWRWSLFINVPLGAVLVALAPRFLPGSEPREGHFDLAGAATSVAGMSLLVFGFLRAASDGWGDSVALVSFATSAALIAGFVLTERRAEQPITPLRLFADRTRAGAYVARVLTVSGMFSMFFFLSQYFQGVRGWSPLHSGLAFLPLTLVMFAMFRLVPRMTARVDEVTLLVGGLVAAAAGMAWLSRVDPSTPFWTGIAAPLVLAGIGIGAAFTPLTSLGMRGVATDDAGAASGLVNAAHQLGGSVGLAVLVTVFAAADDGASRGAHLATGIAHALTGSAVSLVLALLVSVLVLWRPALASFAATRQEVAH